MCLLLAQLEIGFFSSFSAAAVYSTNEANKAGLKFRGNLPPFHGNTIILCYKAILPWKLLWNGSKSLHYINPRKSRVRITVVIYRCIVL